MTNRPPSLPSEDTRPPESGDPIPVKHRMGHVREFTHANSIATDADPNDVNTLRKVNRDQEDSQDKLMRAVDRSAKIRHWRDYWLIMLLGNGLFGLTIWFLPTTMVFAGAGMVVLTLGVTWVYAFVIDPR